MKSSIPPSGKQGASTITCSPPAKHKTGPGGKVDAKPVPPPLRGSRELGIPPSPSSRTIITVMVGDDGACPYFWPIGSKKQDKHIMLHFSHMSGGKYLLGDYDTKRQKFVITDGGDFNHGPVLAGRNPRTFRLSRTRKNPDRRHRSLQHEPGHSQLPGPQPLEPDHVPATALDPQQGRKTPGRTRRRHRVAPLGKQERIVSVPASPQGRRESSSRTYQGQRHGNRKPGSGKKSRQAHRDQSPALAE